MTPLDIINLAMKDVGILGVGQTLSAEDAQDAFTRMNMMVSTWARKRWLIWHLIDVAKVSTGAQSYTVGPGGDFNIVTRPARLEAAYIRQYPGSQTPTYPTVNIAVGASPFVYAAPTAGSITISGGTVSSLQVSHVSGDSAWTAATSPIAVEAGDLVQVTYSVAPTSMVFTPADPVYVAGPIPNNAVDTPLDVLQSMEDYMRISLKAMSSFTTAIFYDTAYPLGRVWPYPIPQATLFELHLLFREPLTQFTSLSQEIILPPEYLAAIEYNLAVRLRPAYQLPVTEPDVVGGLATDALNVLRMSNFQMPRLTMPVELLRNGIYNPYSDQIQ